MSAHAIRGRGRGLGQRPFVLFAILLLVPAVAFGLLGWTSVLREQSLTEREAAAEAEEVVERRVDAVAEALWTIEARETERPYLPVDTAEWLVKREITLFGTDLIGMDDPAEWWWPTHRPRLGTPVALGLDSFSRITLIPAFHADFGKPAAAS